jgi:hypothetical protein
LTSADASLRSIGLPIWILIGASAGVILGECTAILKPLGLAYAMMLQVAVYPYLLYSLLWGLGRLQPVMARRLFAASWGGYLLMWSLTFDHDFEAAGMKHLGKGPAAVMFIDRSRSRWPSTDHTSATRDRSVRPV